MKASSFLLLLLFNSCMASCQSPKITRAYAFEKMLIPGNSPADTNDAKPSRHYLVYIEVPKQNKPSLKKVWITKKTFDVLVSDLDTATISIVTDFSKNKSITLKASKGKTFLLIETSLSEKQRTMPAKYKNVKAGTVLLELSYRNKISYFTVSAIIKLKPNPKEVL